MVRQCRIVMRTAGQDCVEPARSLVVFTDGTCAPACDECRVFLQQAATDMHAPPVRVEPLHDWSNS